MLLLIYPANLIAPVNEFLIIFRDDITGGKSLTLFKTQKNNKKTGKCV